MPERTINTTLAYYTNPDGVSVLGNQGEKVNVHPDTVKRFDELNVLPERTIEEPAGITEVDEEPEPEKPRRGRPRKVADES